ncbi:hypothetical protein EZV62_005239 [Acer yangbiense]|uniref:Glycosyltransferase N-terminal domain-containing protein n=1 Tax=Acer yangbiense TaxID=1000413 RepID=A0A5C7IN80_9ROSI|nr:hypothetical protein EZV62_005239 [Acer yangbiense]
MTCHFLFSSPHSPNPHSSTKCPAHIHPFEDSPHLRQHFTALLHWLLSPTGKRIVIIHDTLMASVVQDSVSIPNTESYAFNTVSAFFSFFDLREALGKPIQIEVEVVPNELPSLKDKADIFTEECRRSAKSPEGFEKRTKGMGMIPEHGSTDCSLAYALRPTKECCADIKAMRRLMASEERDQMRKRANAFRESFKQSLGKDEVSCMELESFTAHITRQIRDFNNENNDMNLWMF